MMMPMRKLSSKLFNPLNLSNNKKKVAKNIYWALIGKITNILSSLFVGVLVARFLGPEQFGLMNYVISYVTLFSVLAGFGLDNIEIRELSKDGDNKVKILGTAFLVRIIFGLTTLILIGVTLFVFESDATTITMVMIYSSTVVTRAFDVIRNYFTSIVLNKYVVKTEITRTLIGACFKLVLLYYKAPLYWFIIASTFDAFLIASGYIIAYKQKTTQSLLTWKFDKTYALYLIKESFPLLLSGTAIIIYQKIDQIIIRNMIDNAALGQFAVASRIIEIGIFLPLVVSQSLAPLLVRELKNNKESYLIKRQQFLDVMLWGAIIISLLISMLSKPLVELMFGNEYKMAIPVLQIMAWKIVFVSMQNSSGQIILIEGIQRYAFYRNIAGCISSIIINYILIPILGIVGSAIATIITLIITGYISHSFITPYKTIFKMQTQSIIYGLKTVQKLKTKISA